MLVPLEDYAIEQLRSKLELVEPVRYTDFSSGANDVFTSSIVGKTYNDLLDCIDQAIDAMIKSKPSYNDRLIGVRVTKINYQKEERRGFYLNLYFGDIQIGDSFYYKLLEESFDRRK